MEQYYELYHNPTYGVPYYYNPYTQESLWELPQGAEDQFKVVDMRSQQEKEAYQDLLAKQKAGQKIDQYEQEELQQYQPEELKDQGLRGEEQEFERAKALFDAAKYAGAKKLMQRPARKQVNEAKWGTAYVEGNYDYNIWYDKYLSDRSVEQERAPALYMCDPDLDTGFTKADLFEREKGYFCVFFAKGCCCEGANCHFFHRVPQPQDLEREENQKDCFGRSRHAAHKEDRSGVGSFQHQSKTLCVMKLRMHRGGSQPVRAMVKLLYDYFRLWGDVLDINFVASKCIAFVKYSHRFYAEFAKEAMQDQRIDDSNDTIFVTWAEDSKITAGKNKSTSQIAEDQRQAIVQRTEARKQQEEILRHQKQIIMREQQEQRREAIEKEQEQRRQLHVDNSRLSQAMKRIAENYQASDINQ